MCADKWIPDAKSDTTNGITTLLRYMVTYIERKLLLILRCAFDSNKTDNDDKEEGNNDIDCLGVLQMQKFCHNIKTLKCMQEIKNAISGADELLWIFLRMIIISIFVIRDEKGAFNQSTYLNDQEAQWGADVVADIEKQRITSVYNTLCRRNVMEHSAKHGWVSIALRMGIVVNV
ncbi:unnamed protein product [Mytilus coruscus]|uniref:Uncharacterized protein n=1 Tax=Mytilus coruscus TaxID=42192 RepID=A0A6J8C249_MYTCO|nr:unnamed protein product [Mytilus coruscus]